MRERVSGAEHPDTLLDRANLARFTGEAGDAAGARDRLAALLPVRERVSGVEHPHTQTVRAYLAYWTEQAERGPGLAWISFTLFTVLRPHRGRQPSQR